MTFHMIELLLLPFFHKGGGAFFVLLFIFACFAPPPLRKFLLAPMPMVKNVLVQIQCTYNIAHTDRPGTGNIQKTFQIIKTL